MRYRTDLAAEMLGLKADTIRRYIRRGLLHAEKDGRDYFIEADEIERYRNERRPPGRPPAQPAPSSNEDKEE